MLRRHSSSLLRMLGGRGRRAASAPASAAAAAAAAAAPAQVPIDLARWAPEGEAWAQPQRWVVFR